MVRVHRGKYQRQDEDRGGGHGQPAPCRQRGPLPVPALEDQSRASRAQGKAGHDLRQGMGMQGHPGPCDERRQGQACQGEVAKRLPAGAQQGEQWGVDAGRDRGMAADAGKIQRGRTNPPAHEGDLRDEHDQGCRQDRKAPAQRRSRGKRPAAPGGRDEHGRGRQQPFAVAQFGEPGPDVGHREWDEGTATENRRHGMAGK